MGIGLKNKTTKKKQNITTLKKKMDSDGWHGLYKYEQKYMYDWYDNKVSMLAQRLPKLIATNGKKQKAQCFTCDKIDTYDMMNGSHFIGRAVRVFKYEEWNIECCCIACNQHNLNRHYNEMQRKKRLELGHEFVDKVLLQAKQINKKPDIRFLIDKYNYYIEKYKSLGFLEYSK